MCTGEPKKKISPNEKEHNERKKNYTNETLVRRVDEQKMKFD